MNFQTIVLTQILLNDLRYFDKSLTLFDQTLVDLNQKKEWNLLDWTRLLLSGGLVVHSAYKTADDGIKLIESFTLKPMKPLKMLKRTPYKIAVTKRNPFLLAT
jgi:hypothetical protein